MHTTETFIDKSIKVHGNRYDYSSVVYVNMRQKVKIRCKEHGVFEQVASQHHQGSGCPTCARHARSTNLKVLLDSPTKTVSGRVNMTDVFVQRAKKMHGDRWDYSKTSYTTARRKVVVTCMEHGDFEVIPWHHLKSRNAESPLGGCPKCNNESKSSPRITHEEFIARAKKVHGEKFDYSFAVYKGYNKPIKIICENHGLIEQNAGSHLRGSGCRFCYYSAQRSKQAA